MEEQSHGVLKRKVVCEAWMGYDDHEENSLTYNEEVLFEGYEEDDGDEYG